MFYSTNLALLICKNDPEYTRTQLIKFGSVVTVCTIFMIPEKNPHEMNMRGQQTGKRTQSQEGRVFIVRTI